LKEHAKLADSCGINPEDTFIMDNGDVLALGKDNGMIAGKIPSGSIYVDGSGIGDIGNIVLRDRRMLSEEGLVIVVVCINMKKYKIASGPDITSPGILNMRESEDLINQAPKLVTNHLNK